jgi:hypothetical protein
VNDFEQRTIPASRGRESGVFLKVYDQLLRRQTPDLRRGAGRFIALSKFQVTTGNFLTADKSMFEISHRK